MRVVFASSALVLLAALMASSTSVGAFAQDEAPPGMMPKAVGQTPGMQHSSTSQAMANMHGMHTMPATVTQADPKTGIVDVMAEGMALRVHFPPSSMVNLKTGDKIGLYMAYSQANVVK